MFGCHRTRGISQQPNGASVEELNEIGYDGMEMEELLLV